MKKTILHVTFLAALVCLGCTDSGMENRDQNPEVDGFLRMFTRENLSGNTAYTLTTNASPQDGGTVSRNPDKASYTFGEPVTVTATPANGHIFTGWSGAATGTTNPVVVTMDGNKALTAGFGLPGVTRFTVYFNGNGKTGGNVPDAITADSGSDIRLPEQLAMERTGYRFGGWNTKSDGTGTNYAANSSYAVMGNVTLYAMWTAQTYKLTTTVSPSNGGAVSRSPDKWEYTFGEVVTVTATPSGGYTFTGWSGASTSTSSSVTVTMDGDKTLTAGFGKQGARQFTVYFNSNGGGDSPASVTADSGNSITLPDQRTMLKDEYAFGGWNTTSDGTGTKYAANSSYKVTRDITLYAVWTAQTWTLTTNVSPSGGGSVSRSPNQTSYANETSVTVTAAAANGYEFTGWSGASTSTNSSVTITMNGNKTLTANFQKITYTLTTSVSPSGGGSVSRSPNQTNYANGTSVTVTATAASGYEFTGWSGASTSTNTSVTITMNDNKTLTANFQQTTVTPTTYTLTTSVSPLGGGTVSRIPNATSYESGASVTVTAAAASGYTFTGWSGASTSTSTSITITMNGDKALTANFTQNPTTYTLTTSVSPSGGGSVSRSPNATNYESGASVTVTAAAASGYTFTGWSGASTSTSTSITITMNGDKAVTANFQQITYTLTTEISPSGGGSVSHSPNQTSYTSGTSVTVTASAASGYTFTGWSGASTSTSTSITITMNGDKTLTANFQQNPTTYTLTTSVSPSGGGSVSRNPNQTSYTNGTSVTVTASAVSGYTFTGWSGASTLTSSSITITMNGDKTLTANFQQSVVVTPSIGEFTDNRDGKKYKKVTIGTQTWMAENLNYETSSGSWCYDCAKYGRLYDWSTAMGGSSSSTMNPSGVRGACPVGWHLPSRVEWEALVNYVGGTVGTKLKSSSGWNAYSGIPFGTNDYGFSALPGGFYSVGSFYYVGYYGLWWSATEDDASVAYAREMRYSNLGVNESWVDKSAGISVRCVGD